MDISFNIECLSEKEQYKVYQYLKTKFEIDPKLIGVMNVPVKEIKEFPGKLRYTLLRNGIFYTSDLLKLNKQDLINLSGIGTKSREIIKGFCKKYRLEKLTMDID